MPSHVAGDLFDGRAEPVSRPSRAQRGRSVAESLDAGEHARRRGRRREFGLGTAALVSPAKAKADGPDTQRVEGQLRARRNSYPV